MSETPSAIDLVPIKSETRTIQSCFQRCLYDVPSFQRPYSWDTDELIEYWDDVVLANGDFFFGSTVTWVSEKRELFNSTYSIIDGQQRLTTSAIALSVVRDSFKKIQKDNPDEESSRTAKAQAEATQKYLIINDDDEAKTYPVIHRPEGMFYQNILQPDAIPSTARWNQSARRIGAARKFFEERVLAELSQCRSDDQIDRLKEIRANILKARVIQVELLSEEDGFLVFETLNTRGSDLRLADLVKNLLIRDGAHTPEDRTTISKRWDSMAESIERTSNSADVLDRFLWQSWNSRRKALKVPELFKELSGALSSGNLTHMGYLEELEFDADIYCRLGDPRIMLSSNPSGGHGNRDAFDIGEFVDAVRALAIFDVTVAHSAVMALARKYHESNLISRKKLVEAIRMIENFHFQFNALTSSSSTGGTRSRYNRFSVDLENANSRQSISEIIEDLRQKLSTSLPAENAAISAFEKLFYAPKLKISSAQKKRGNRLLIAYVLMGFMRQAKISIIGQDPSQYSIEHMKPQAESSGAVSDPVFSIGNLILLTKELNTDLADGPFANKAAKINGTWGVVDPVIRDWATLSVTNLTNDHINTRLHALALRAVRDIWSI